MSDETPPEWAPNATVAWPRPTAPLVADTPTERRRFDSRQLLGSGHEVEIAHAGAIYRLRRTALGKLILTK